MSDIWKTLSVIDVNEHTEQKQGMTYLSWAWAWSIVKDIYPDAKFKKHQFDGPNGKRPYMIDEHGFAFVMVTVSIGDEEQTEILPVLKGNKPIQGPNSFEINTALQRCLVKALAYFGLGHYIYAGEDLPSGANDVTSPVQAVAVEKDPPSQTSPAPSDLPEDDLEAQNKRYDRAFYMDMSSKLTQARHISKVHGLFEEMKPKIQEIKKRSPERAQRILELFMEHEDRLSKGDSNGPQ